MKKRRTGRYRTTRAGAEGPFERTDHVAAEEPLEMRLEWRGSGGERIETPVAVTMRTPGDDFDLAIGFLLTEGVISGAQAITGVRYCGEVSPQEYNVVTVALGDPEAFDPSSLARNFYVTSSCGVCGKASLEAVRNLGCESLDDHRTTVPAQVIRELPERLRGAQPVFRATGGLHAAAAFAAGGEFAAIREDVGRHNAVDKVVGSLAREGANGGGSDAPPGLVVSGRASFEIMQKAAMARVPVVVAVGAPSTLAVDFARDFGMTLAGFASSSSFNLYSRPDRIGGLTT